MWVLDSFQGEEAAGGNHDLPSTQWGENGLKATQSCTRQWASPSERPFFAASRLQEIRTYKARDRKGFAVILGEAYKVAASPICDEMADARVGSTDFRLLHWISQSPPDRVRPLKVLFLRCSALSTGDENGPTAA